MVRRLLIITRPLPRAGVLRLYDAPDVPLVLPGERAVQDGDDWIVEPVPGVWAAGQRRYWSLLGQWIWALRHLTGSCACVGLSNGVGRVA